LRNERNKANLTIAVARRLTKALGINLNRLFASASHDVDPMQAAGPHDIPTRLGGQTAHHSQRRQGRSHGAVGQHTPITTATWAPFTSASHDHGSPIKPPLLP
jgi:hypothetical protein